MTKMNVKYKTRKYCNLMPLDVGRFMPRLLRGYTKFEL